MDDYPILLSHLFSHFVVAAIALIIILRVQAPSAPLRLGMMLVESVRPCKPLSTTPMPARFKQAATNVPLLQMFGALMAHLLILLFEHLVTTGKAAGERTLPSVRAFMFLEYCTSCELFSTCFTDVLANSVIVTMRQVLVCCLMVLDMTIV